MKTKKSSEFEMPKIHSLFDEENTQSGSLRAKATGGRQRVEQGGVEMGAVSRAPGGEYKDGGEYKEGKADTRRNTETTNP